MDRAAFERWVAMLRSNDDLTYEDGYACFMSYFEAVRDSPYVEDLIELALKETTAEMCYRFVEVLGLSATRVRFHIFRTNFHIRITIFALQLTPPSKANFAATLSPKKWSRLSNEIIHTKISLSLGGDPNRANSRGIPR